jgi:hypothetical protein
VTILFADTVDRLCSRTSILQQSRVIQYISAVFVKTTMPSHSLRVMVATGPHGNRTRLVTKAGLAWHHDSGVPPRNVAVLPGVAVELRTNGGAAVATLTCVVLQCYYSGNRVVRSLGPEPRPPYPKGHVLEDGDWSLLDPVRARPPM